jgi:hypothetical protein
MRSLAEERMREEWQTGLFYTRCAAARGLAMSRRGRCRDED